jgi:hypothetical protein
VAVDVPGAPWLLEGECVAAVVWGRPRAPLPAGLRAMPGPQLVLGVRYHDSPVGPYSELAVAQPARLGTRLGLYVTAMVVDSAASQVGGRLNWGFPKELGTLRWAEDGDERELAWEEGGVRLWAVGGRAGLPAVVPLRAVQRRRDGLVLVNARVRGFVRPGRALVEAGGGPLAPLAGRFRGVLVAGLRATFRPARQPAGVFANLRATPGPIRSPRYRVRPCSPGD